MRKRIAEPGKNGEKVSDTPPAEPEPWYSSETESGLLVAKRGFPVGFTNEDLERWDLERLHDDA